MSDAVLGGLVVAYAAALVRFRGTTRVVWPAVLLLAALAVTDILASRRAAPRQTRGPSI